MCCNAGNLGTWFWIPPMELTYEMLGIRPLLIEKLNIDPISRSQSFIRIATALLRAGYAPATRRTEVITPSWLQPEAKERGVARTP
jgi:hypothetical protein